MQPTSTTVWHIIFGTYGARLHGGQRATVARPNNRPGDPFVLSNDDRERANLKRMRAHAIELTVQQQRFIEFHLPAICDRGGWKLQACAAAPDYVHILLEADAESHGKQIRPLLKRWLTQALSERRETPRRPDGSGWWAQGGATRAVKDSRYLKTATMCIEEQRASRPVLGE